MTSPSVPDGIRASAQINPIGNPRQMAARTQEEAAIVLEKAYLRIATLERGRIVLIATLAAFPLTLIALLVLALSQPVAPPAPSLSMVAAVVGCLLTGGLIFLGAWAASAIMGPVRPAPDAPPP